MPTDKDRNPTAPLSVVLIGAGGLGQHWASVIGAELETELVGVVDPLVGSDRQPEWLAKLDGISMAPTLSGLECESIDAAVVVAHSPAHAEAVDAALRQGLSVLVEKPFTLSLRDAAGLVEQADDAGLTLMVSQNYRFFPGVETIRRLIADGDVGSVRAVECRFWIDWPGKPYQHAMQHVMGLEMAIHHFDLARAMFDAEPQSGVAREWNPQECQYAGGAGIEALYDMRAPAGTFPFVYSGSLVGRAPKTPWGGLWRIEFDRTTVIVDEIGDEYGMLRAADEGLEKLGPFAAENMSFDASLRHFVECFRSGSEPWSSGRDNLNTLRMALDFLP